MLCERVVGTIKYFTYLKFAFESEQSAQHLVTDSQSEFNKKHSNCRA